MLADILQPAPNVVFILADNVGYGDLGPYGGGELRGAPTPRIDQLARDGTPDMGSPGPFRGELGEVTEGSIRTFTGIGPQRQPGPGSASAPMAGYPKIFNIEMDQHEDLNVFDAGRGVQVSWMSSALGSRQVSHVIR